MRPDKHIIKAELETCVPELQQEGGGIVRLCVVLKLGANLVLSTLHRETLKQ